MIWWNEPFSSPMRLPAGTRTSSKKTSQKSRPPVASTMRLTLTPGERTSTTRSDRPSWGLAVGSVRHTR
jgi:hypothetical protein